MASYDKTALVRAIPEKGIYEMYRGFGKWKTDPYGYTLWSGWSSLNLNYDEIEEDQIKEVMENIDKTIIEFMKQQKEENS
ncbi:MAG: hypothetical protein QFX32_05930 [Methanolinea sp.]|nr:hypothetical protein [Methanolinea sp.]